MNIIFQNFSKFWIGLTFYGRRGWGSLGELGIRDGVGVQMKQFRRSYYTLQISHFYLWPNREYSIAFLYFLSNFFKNFFFEKLILAFCKPSKDQN